MIAFPAGVRAFERRRPSRKPFPDHLPRERVVLEAPAASVRCHGNRYIACQAPFL